MTMLMLILKFWGGLLLLFVFGWLIGQLTQLNKHIKSLLSGYNSNKFN